MALSSAYTGVGLAHVGINLNVWLFLALTNALTDARNIRLKRKKKKHPASCFLMWAEEPACDWSVESSVKHTDLVKGGGSASHQWHHKCDKISGLVEHTMNNTDNE